MLMTKNFSAISSIVEREKEEEKMSVHNIIQNFTYLQVLKFKKSF